MNISELEKRGFNGVDVNLNISLFEYGIAWKVYRRAVPSKSIETGDIEFIYGIGVKENEFGDTIYNGFSTAYFNKNLQFDQEFNWIDKKAISSFLGMTIEEFDDCTILDKILACYHYYGAVEIFGESYHSGFSIGNTWEYYN